MEQVWKEFNLADIVTGGPSLPNLNVAFEDSGGGGLPLDAPPPSVNRRRQRMMKNRESAARSRARKQAYINQLQLDIARWRSENARLRRQLKKPVLQAPIAEPVPPKHNLHRTLTAPF